MKLYLVDTFYLDDAILTEAAFHHLQAMMNDDGYTAKEIEHPTDEDMANALYWDHDEQAFMSGAFDEEENS